jgi:hypothetical protein
MASANEAVKYETFPASVGTHHPTPAVWNIYSQPVDPRQAVHNLEHGAIVIWYGMEVPEAERRKLEDFYDEDPLAILVTPLPTKSPGVTYPPHEPLGTRIALSAWTADVNTASGEVSNERGVVSICPRFDEGAFTAFRDEFRGKGPERVDVSAQRPGTIGG